MEAEATPYPPAVAGNLALVVGELATDPEFRVLPGGTELLSFSVTVRQPGEATTSVPLTWFDPPGRTRRWKVGAQIVAVGRVVRRFYKAGATTGSRTDVVVHQAEASTRKARARAVLGQVVVAVDELAARLE